MLEYAEIIRDKVSIPERVLEALKPETERSGIAERRVSIPERVLEALKLWDTSKNYYHNALVSIPERVLEALKPKLPLLICTF